MATICIRTKAVPRLAAFTPLPHSECIISKMPAEMKEPREALRNAALIAAGLIVAAIPLVLWVAWSQATLFLGLAASGAFGLLFFVLYADPRATNEDQRKDPRSGTVEPLDEEFLSELSNMEPFVYHNCLLGDSRFQKMVRLKKRLVSSDF